MASMQLAVRLRHAFRFPVLEAVGDGWQPGPDFLRVRVHQSLPPHHIHDTCYVIAYRHRSTRGGITIRETLLTMSTSPHIDKVNTPYKHRHTLLSTVNSHRNPHLTYNQTVTGIQEIIV